jgi:hypothetical protein
MKKLPLFSEIYFADFAPGIISPERAFRTASSLVISFQSSPAGFLFDSHFAIYLTASLSIRCVLIALAPWSLSPLDPRQRDQRCLLHQRRRVHDAYHPL